VLVISINTTKIVSIVISELMVGTAKATHQIEQAELCTEMQSATIANGKMMLCRNTLKLSYFLLQ
jgi:hypothetical protein